MKWAGFDVERILRLMIAELLDILNVDTIRTIEWNDLLKYRYVSLLVQIKLLSLMILICLLLSWWRHQMETFFALLAFCVINSPVTGEFPAQRPVTGSFDVFFDLHLNKRLSRQS